MSSKKDIELITDPEKLKKIMEQNNLREGGASFRGTDIEEESRMNQLYNAASRQLKKVEGNSETQTSGQASSSSGSYLESTENFISRAFMSDEERQKMDKEAREREEKATAAQKLKQAQEKALALEKQQKLEHQEQEILEQKDPVERINLAKSYGRRDIIRAEFMAKDGVTLNAYLDHIDQNPKLSDEERFQLVNKVVLENVPYDDEPMPQASRDVILRNFGRLQYLTDSSKKYGVKKLLSVKNQELLKPIDHTILAEHFAAEKTEKGKSAAAYPAELNMLEHLYQAAINENGADKVVNEARSKLRKYLNIDVDTHVKEEKNKTLSPDIQAAYQKKRGELQTHYSAWQEAEAVYEKAQITYAKDSKLAEEKYENSRGDYERERGRYIKNATKYNKAHEGIVEKVKNGRSGFEPIAQTIKSIDDFVADKKLSPEDGQVPENINELSLDALLNSYQTSYPVNKLRNMVVEKIKRELGEIELLCNQVVERSNPQTYESNRKQLHEKISSLYLGVSNCSKNPKLKQGNNRMKNFISNPFVENLSALSKQIGSLRNGISQLPEKPYEGVRFDLIEPKEPAKPIQPQKPVFVPPKLENKEVRVLALDEKRHPSQNIATAQIGVNRSGSFVKPNSGGGATITPKSSNPDQTGNPSGGILGKK